MADGDHSEHEKTFTVIVNGQEKKVTQETLTFTAVVALAFNPVPSGPNILFTVTFRNAKEPREGTLVEGQSVEIKNGTIFNVTQTDKS
jgi:multiubiquitin